MEHPIYYVLPSFIKFQSYWDAVIRLHVVFKGLVQGVFFRAHTKEKAQRLGVMGWVMNLPNGDVEAILEGEEGHVNALIEYCKKGQPHARVDKAIVNMGAYTGEFRDFRIRR
jgi:acylphosphatase